MLCTFRRPSMCRPVPRQLLRNAVLDVTPIVPATAYHRRSYAERYSRYRRAGIIPPPFNPGRAPPCRCPPMAGKELPDAA